MRPGQMKISTIFLNYWGGPYHALTSSPLSGGRQAAMSHHYFPSRATFLYIPLDPRKPNYSFLSYIFRWTHVNLTTVFFPIYPVGPK